MSFGGARAIVMGVVFVVLLLAVTKLDLPGWLLPVGLIGAGVVLKNTTVKRASA